MDDRKKGGMQIRPAWIAAAGLGVLALAAGGVPLVSLLYVGLLLLCPLLMAGMHGGHGRASGHEGPDGLGPGASNPQGPSSPADEGQT
jgi:hypothetical protein